MNKRKILITTMLCMTLSLGINFTAKASFGNGTITITAGNNNNTGSGAKPTKPKPAPNVVDTPATEEEIIAGNDEPDIQESFFSMYDKGNPPGQLSPYAQYKYERTPAGRMSHPQTVTWTTFFDGGEGNPDTIIKHTKIIPGVFATYTGAKPYTTTADWKLIDYLWRQQGPAPLYHRVKGVGGLNKAYYTDDSIEWHGPQTEYFLPSTITNVGSYTVQARPYKSWNILNGYDYNYKYYAVYADNKPRLLMSGYFRGTARKTPQLHDVDPTTTKTFRVFTQDIGNIIKGEDTKKLNLDVKTELIR